MTKAETFKINFKPLRKTQNLIFLMPLNGFKKMFAIFTIAF